MTAITESPDVVALLDKVSLTPMELNASKHVVCVTGSTGIVGSHIVRRLLRSGHTVHAPVRSLAESKVGFLKTMPGASDRLKLFKVTGLADPGAYDASMAGCDTLMHVASAFFMTGSKEELDELLYKPALQGVENILASCNRTKTMKRVIMTGTCMTASATGSNDPDRRVDEDDWETTASRDDFPYVHSKVLQGRRAEEIAAKQSQWEYVDLMIAGSFGPMCFTNATDTSALFLKYARMGLFFPACPPMGFPMNDLRDVAYMHCVAMCQSSKKLRGGRYLPPMKFVTFYEFCDALRSHPDTSYTLLPWFEFPTTFFKSLFGKVAPSLGIDKALPHRMWGKTLHYDTSKCETDFDLEGQGYKRLGIKDSIVDMELTFQKYGVSNFSPSLDRYKMKQSDGL